MNPFDLIIKIELYDGVRAISKNNLCKAIRASIMENTPNRKVIWSMDKDVIKDANGKVIGEWYATL